MPTTSTSYAIDESGVWAWRKGTYKPKDVTPSDPLDVLTRAQRKARKKKGIVEADATVDMVEETQRRLVCRLGAEDPQEWTRYRP